MLYVVCVLWWVLCCACWVLCILHVVYVLCVVLCVCCVVCVVLYVCMCLPVSALPLEEKRVSVPLELVCQVVVRCSACGGNQVRVLSAKHFLAW